MTIQEAIQKAIEGGWRYRNSDNIEIFPSEIATVPRCLVAFKDGYNEYVHVAVFLLDPLFWQSLGKAMGWEKQYEEDAQDCTGEGCSHETWGEEKWILEWHRFIDHLAEGKDIESFFETL